MHPKTEAMDRLYTKWRNPAFSALLESIKENASASFTDAIFLLYDLAGEGADTFVRHMKMVKDRANSDGKGHDFTALIKGGEVGLSFLVFPTADSIHTHLLAFCKARKHKARARTWLGFASYVGSARPVDCAVYSDFAWEYDAELEDLGTKMLKKGQAVDPPGAKIGRNDPCVCGSGKNAPASRSTGTARGQGRP